MALETLTCESCDNDWQRKVVRGRKPKECPTCKGEPAPSPVVPQEERAKRKVKVYGKDVNPLWTDEGKTHFKRFELDGEEVKMNTTMVYEGEKYAFRSLVVRNDEDNTAYCNLLGRTGIYKHKFRAIGLDKLELA